MLFHRTLSKVTDCLSVSTEVGRSDIGLELLEPRRLLSSYVVDTIVDESDGDYSAGDLSLREAIELANANVGKDTVTFDSVAFSGGGTITLGGTQIHITDSIEIAGDTLNQVTIDADDKSRIFQFNNTAATLTDLRFINGNESNGGAIAAYASDLTFHGLMVEDSYASIDGGGLYAFRSTVTMTDTVFENNSALDEGGGIAALIYSVVNISNSRISANEAEYGGGVNGHYESTLVFTYTTIDHNIASNAGGGIRGNQSSLVHIESSAIHDNQATISGGGISNFGSTLAMKNSTISANHAAGEYAYAGGIEVMSSRGGAQLISNTFTGNTATGRGGAIGVVGSAIVLNNNLFVGNTAPVSSELFGNSYSGEHNLIADPESSGGIVDGVDGNIVGLAGTVIAPQSILDQMLSNNGGVIKTHALVNGSLATDAGDDAAAIAAGLINDQRGDPYPRITGDSVDIGAFEINNSNESRLYVVDTTVDENDGDYSLGDLSLREAIALANADAAANTILFDSQAFNDGGTIVLDGSMLTLSEDISIQGALDRIVTIDANGNSGVFEVRSNVNATFSNLVITGGDNSFGGGIYAFSDASVVIENSTITGNAANVGGGVYGVSGVSLSIRNSTISGNSATDSGGGVFIGYRSQLTLLNSTISGNIAGRIGGGVGTNQFDENTIEIVNSTITGNTANTGGGLYVGDYSTATLRNTLIAGNTGFTTVDDIDGTVSGENNLIGDADSSAGLSDGVDGNIVGDGGTATLAIETILDTTLADNGGPTLTHALRPGSKAIDAASQAHADAALLTTDQRLSPYGRSVGDGPDIGAFEVTGYLSMDSNQIAEHAANGTVIGTISATDMILGSSGWTFALVDQSLFAIDSATGQVTSADSGGLDFETESSPEIDVIATHSSGFQLRKTIAIQILDVNEAPTGIAVDQNVIRDYTVSPIGIVSAIDPDAADSHTFSIIQDDHGLFAIDSATGQLTRQTGVGSLRSAFIVVRATDQVGAFVDQRLDFSIEVNSGEFTRIKRPFSLINGVPFKASVAARMVNDSGRDFADLQHLDVQLVARPLDGEDVVLATRNFRGSWRDGAAKTFTFNNFIASLPSGKYYLFLKAYYQAPGDSIPEALIASGHRNGGYDYLSVDPETYRDLMTQTEITSKLPSSHKQGQPLKVKLRVYVTNEGNIEMPSAITDLRVYLEDDGENRLGTITTMLVKLPKLKPQQSKVVNVNFDLPDWAPVGHVNFATEIDVMGVITENSQGGDAETNNWSRLDLSPLEIVPSFIDLSVDIGDKKGVRTYASGKAIRDTRTLRVRNGGNVPTNKTALANVVIRIYDSLDQLVTTQLIENVKLGNLKLGKTKNVAARMTLAPLTPGDYRTVYTLEPVNFVDDDLSDNTYQRAFRVE